MDRLLRYDRYRSLEHDRHRMSDGRPIHIREQRHPVTHWDRDGKLANDRVG